jgi:hypothetical protein
VAGARANLAPYDVEVVHGRFEDWDTGGFALVYAATARHWIDPAMRYQRAWSVLREGWPPGVLERDSCDPRE